MAWLGSRLSRLWRLNILRRQIYESKHFFDYDDGDFAHTISDNMAIGSDGNMLMRMGDNMAMDMDSGELHIISSWDNEDEDD